MTSKKRALDISFFAWEAHRQSAEEAAQTRTEFFTKLNSTFIRAKHLEVYQRVEELIVAFQDAARRPAERPSFMEYPDLACRLADYPVIYEPSSIALPGEKGVLRLGEKNFGTRLGLEFWLALAVIQFAKEGLILRVRRCTCGNWFLAKREASQSCDKLKCLVAAAKCRRLRYEKKDSGKVRRREYTRWYYGEFESPNAPKTGLAFPQWLKLPESERGGRNAKRKG
jgi:hypothetical protein